MGDPMELRNAVIDSSQFQLDLHLQSKKLLRYLLFMTIIYGAFTITFYVGIPITTVYEAIGTSARSEELMETYNMYSSHLMALVEVLISIYMGSFLPVLEVYIHNRLFFLQCDAKGNPRPRKYRRLYSALMLVLTAILVLTNGSIKSLQAVPFTTDIRRVVTIEDMKKEEPMLEQIRKRAQAKKTRTNQFKASDTVLKNAIRQQATPFTFDTKSVCGRRIAGEDTGPQSEWKLDPHEMGSTSAIYGFVPREWNSEAMTITPTQSSNYTVNYTVTYQQAVDARSKNVSLTGPANFSLRTAFEMLVQAKMVIERAVGNSVTGSYKCSLSDGLGDKALSLNPLRSTATLSNDTVVLRDEDGKNQWTYDDNGVRQCEGGVSSMHKMGDFYNRSAFTAEDLVLNATNIISITIPSISRKDTQITLNTYDLTPQIRLETMQIDLVLDKSVVYGDQSYCMATDASCDVRYSFRPLQNTICGSNNCAFIDVSGSFPVQPEIGVLPYYTDCSLGPGQVHYSADFRGFYPDACIRSTNSTFLYGYGSYIAGDEFGSYAGDLNASYIVAPRRHITFIFARVVWKLEKLEDVYGAKCNLNLDCSGLSYQLQPSGRFLFAGKASLPLNALRSSGFRSPIQLVQLNSPTFAFNGTLATVERLAPENFRKRVWPGKAIYNNSALGGSKCSMLIDSYLKHVNDNNYFLERPLQVMSTSFFYFLMQDAAVAELNDTSLALDDDKTGRILMTDRLGNVRLKGDRILRSIRVSIPLTSFLTTLAGCICIFVATIVIVSVPARHVKYFPEGTTKAEQFVAMRKDADYPDDVHDKLVRNPETRDIVRFQDLEIEALALTHVSTLSNAAGKYLPSKDQEEASESESDVSQVATSEELP